MRISTVLLLLAVVGETAGCGMSTHEMVGHRARTYFLNITAGGGRYAQAITKNPEAVQGGSDFPDFLYACGEDHNAGEYAHWEGFHVSGARVLRDRPDFVSGEWTEDTEKLVAFMFGTVVHFSADTSFHGIDAEGTFGNSGAGFIRYLDAEDFGGTGSISDKAANMANAGGDFYMAWGADESYISPAKRYFPTSDILEVYKRAGPQWNVTGFSVDECKVIFDVGMWAEKTFGRLLWRTYSKKSPQTGAHILTFPVAGVDDMAAWAGTMWVRYAGWLENGPPSWFPEHPTDNNIDRTVRPGDVSLRKLVQELKRFDSRLLEKLLELLPSTPMFDANGKYVGPALLEPVVRGVKRALVKAYGLDGEIELGEDEAMLDYAEADQTLLPGDKGLAYSGRSVATGDWDGDGRTDIASGAPGAGEFLAGSVALQYGNGTTATIAGTRYRGKLGWSMVTVDYNLDGVDDLAVSAPTAGWSSLEAAAAMPQGCTHGCLSARYYGEVLVFLGERGRGLSPSHVVNITTPAIRMMLFGSGQLAAGDVDGDGHADLVVGSMLSGSTPHKGSHGYVHVLPASTTPATTPLISIEGDAYTMLGAAIAVHNRTVIASSPGARVNGTAVGKVAAYRADGSLVWETYGDVPRGQFGWGLAVGPQGDLAVGTPHAGGKHEGKVAVYSIPPSAPLRTHTGSKAEGRLGWAVGWAGDNTLVASAPMISTGGVLRGGETGAIYTWEEPSASPRVFAARDLRARLGHSLVVSNNTVLAGAPFTKIGAHEFAGQVHRISL